MADNLVKVYDKDDEMFEMTPLNAQDVVKHAGWTLEPKGKTSSSAPVDAAISAKVKAKADPKGKFDTRGKVSSKKQ